MEADTILPTPMAVRTMKAPQRASAFAEHEPDRAFCAADARPPLVARLVPRPLAVLDVRTPRTYGSRAGTGSAPVQWT